MAVFREPCSNLLSGPMDIDLHLGTAPSGQTRDLAIDHSLHHSKFERLAVFLGQAPQNHFQLCGEFAEAGP